MCFDWRYWYIGYDFDFVRGGGFWFEFIMWYFWGGVDSWFWGYGGIEEGG